MKNFIAYLAYGDIGYLNECRFSLLRYLSVYNLQPPTGTTFLIYTDRPQHFEMFLPHFKNMRLENVSKEKIEGWIAGTNYVHRAKTKMIQEVLANQQGNLIFFDTDTYITQPIEHLWKDIENGITYFHTSEGVIDRERNHEFRKWDRFLSATPISYGNKVFAYSKDFEVWNSGVLGLSPRYAPVIDDVLLLIDSIYRKFPKHITEQVACSYCFQEQAPMKAAKDTVFHYWNLKEFRGFLQRFFNRHEEESIPTLVKLAGHIDVDFIQQEKHRYHALSFAQRWLRNIAGKSWKIEKYEKNFSP
jgi:hypothetical protein